MSGKIETITADERRRKILDQLSEKPLNATYLGEQCGVSRQVIVQDIALLRAQGIPVVSTNRGYIVAGGKVVRRVFKVYHTEKEILEELNLIVDNGGCVEDVIVSHRIYGQIVGKLNIENRVQASEFMRSIENGKSRPLMLVTEGYHYHTVSARDEQNLSKIQKALSDRGFLLDE